MALTKEEEKFPFLASRRRKLKKLGMQLVYNIRIVYGSKSYYYSKLSSFESRDVAAHYRKFYLAVLFEALSMLYRQLTSIKNAA